MSENTMRLNAIEMVSETPNGEYNPTVMFNISYRLKRGDGSVELKTLEKVPNPFPVSVSLRDMHPTLKCFEIDGEDRNGCMSHITCESIKTEQINPPTVPLEVTMAEIEKKFGRPIKIVKETYNGRKSTTSGKC